MCLDSGELVHSTNTLWAKVEAVGSYQWCHQNSSNGLESDNCETEFGKENTL